MKIININNNQTNSTFNAKLKVEGCLLPKNSLKNLEEIIHPIGKECDVITFSTQHGLDKKFNINCSKIKEDNKLNLSDGRKLYCMNEKLVYGSYDSRLEQIETYIKQRLKEIINLSK